MSPKAPLLLAALLTACASPSLAQPPPSAVGEIPFRYIDHVFLDVALNDSLHAILVYDPVRNVMLDERFARDNRIPTFGGEEVGYGAPVTVGGAGGEEHVVTFARGLTVTAGTDPDVPVLERTFNLTPTIPLDSMMAVALGRTVDGLFGINVLADHVLEFDFERERFVLHDTLRFTPPDDAVSVPISPIGRAGKPSVPVTVYLDSGDAVTGQFVLDFGMGGVLRLTTGFTESHGLVDRVGPTVGSGAETGLGGALQSLFARVPAVSIGDLRVEAPVLSLAQETEGADAYPDHDGLIGLGLIDRYRVFYDAPGATLWLAPTDRTRQPFIYADPGLRWEPVGRRSGGLVVREVTDGGAAAAACLHPGDRLLSVDGVDASGWTKREWRAAVDAAAFEGHTLTLEVVRGAEVIETSLQVTESL